MIKIYETKRRQPLDKMAICYSVLTKYILCVITQLSRNFCKIKTMKIALTLALLCLVADASGSSPILPKFEVFRQAAQEGNLKKIQELIALASEHVTMIDSKDLSWLLLDVSESAKPEAIDMLVKFAARRYHPFGYYKDFGSMLMGAARSGSHEAIDLVVSLADDYHSLIRPDDFSLAMAWAAGNGDASTVVHVFAIAAQSEVGLDAGHFGDNVLSSAAKSGDPETIAIVHEIAIQYGLKFQDKHVGWALQYAAGKNAEGLRQVDEIATKQGIKLEKEYFVEAIVQATSIFVSDVEYTEQRVDLVADLMADFADKHSINPEIHHAIKAKMQVVLDYEVEIIELTLDLADKHGIKFTADDFGQAMAAAARRGKTTRVEKMLAIVGRHGITLDRKHFVASMQQAMQGGHLTTVEQTASLGNEYGITFNGDDFFQIILEALNSFRYQAMSSIVDLADKYDAKLTGKHFSQLLAKAARGNSSKEFAKERMKRSDGIDQSL